MVTSCSPLYSCHRVQIQLSYTQNAQYLLLIYKNSISQLPLLKALIDRLLQDGMEELLHDFSTNRRSKDDRKDPNSNIITEYTVTGFQVLRDWVRIQGWTTCINITVDLKLLVNTTIV